MVAKVAKRKSLSIGDSILNGRYKITKILHVNGMANVYLAVDTNLGKLWCIKEVVLSESGRDNIEVVSLLNEANILKNITFSSIPRIVTIEDEEGSRFIVMDYIEGVSLKDLLVNKGALNQDLAVKFSKQVCEILMFLHRKVKPAIYYRDMKPDNIMIQDNGDIKLLDFGISVVLSDKNKMITQSLGTKGYAAPEQRKKGLPYDLRSDIYSFGMTMYHMLTGINPAVVEQNGQSLRPIREVNSSLSMGLEQIVNKCIQRNPEDRYQTIEEVMYDLKNYEKLDSSYKKKQRKKLNTVLALAGTSIFLGISSFIPLGIHNAEIVKDYEKELGVAVQTGRVEDYVKAISYKPLELDPYTGLIESTKTDGVFTKDEETSILNIISPNLEDIKKEKKYGEIAFDIGKLYWFYYEGDDRDVVSTKWFKEAMDKEYNYDEAKLYYDLGSFKKDIAMSIAESSDSGMYKVYWDNLMSAKNIANGEIVELQLYNTITDAISTYSYRLKSDGIPKEDIEKEIESIKAFLSVYIPISEKAKSLFDTLSKNAQTLNDTVNAAYNLGGN